MERRRGGGAGHRNAALKRDAADGLHERRRVRWRNRGAISGGRPYFDDAFGFERRGGIPRLVKSVRALRLGCRKAGECAGEADPQTQQQNDPHRLYCTEFTRVCRNAFVAYGKNIRQSEARRQVRYPASGAILFLWTGDDGNERMSRGQVLRVSLSGLQLRVDHKVPLRACLFCNDQVLGICGRGTVRYCNQVHGKFEIGLEFSGGTGWKKPL